MAEPPKQPRNAEVVSKQGQFNQAHSRWWDSIARRAYSAIQRFNEFFQLDTIGEAVDQANDYLLIYNASDAEAQKVAVGSIITDPVYLAYSQARSGITTNTTYSAGANIVNVNHTAADAANLLKISVDIRWRTTTGAGGGTARVAVFRDSTELFDIGQTGGGSVGVNTNGDWHGSFVASVPDTSTHTYSIRWTLQSGNISAFLVNASSLYSPLIIVEELTT